MQVDTPGHEALQLHSGGVVLFCIRIVGGHGSPASKGGPAGLRHSQLHKLLGAGAKGDTEKEHDTSHTCHRDANMEEQTRPCVSGSEQLAPSSAKIRPEKWL